MRALIPVALSFAMAACDFPYSVGAVDAALLEDVAEETFDSEVDTGTDTATDAATDAPMSCADAGAMACNQCVSRQCPSAALECNDEPTCKAWLTCAAMCTCPRTDCLKACDASSPTMTNGKLLDCLTMGCAVECR